MLEPPEDFFRLAPGKEVRLKYAYWIKCYDVSNVGLQVVVQTYHVLEFDLVRIAAMLPTATLVNTASKQVAELL